MRPKPWSPGTRMSGSSLKPAVALSYDEKEMALINIVPEQIRADIMIRLHMFPDPNPLSPQHEQDECFTKLRGLLQKQIELSIQVQMMDSNRGSGPVNSFDDARRTIGIEPEARMPLRVGSSPPQTTQIMACS